VTSQHSKNYPSLDDRIVSVSTNGFLRRISHCKNNWAMGMGAHPAGLSHGQTFDTSYVNDHLPRNWPHHSSASVFRDGFNSRPTQGQ
jgi:hypothetical protein